MDGVNFEETRFFISIGIISTNRYLFFQEISRFCAMFTPESQFFLVCLEFPVNGSGTNIEQQFFDFWCDMKSRL